MRREEKPTGPTKRSWSESDVSAEGRPEISGDRAGLRARLMTLEYLLVLGVLAVLSLSSYRLMLKNINTQKDDARLVNLSGRQRMLTQRVMAFSQLLETSHARADRIAARRKLKSAIDSMKTSHYILANSQSRDLSTRMRAIYFAAPHLLDEKVRRYLLHAQVLVELSDRELAKGDAIEVHVLASAAEKLLKSLDAASSQYQLESENRVSRLRNLQGWVTAGILILLALSGGFVFRPMVARVSQEHSALEELNATLERRVEERSKHIEELRDRYYHSVNHELRTPITCLNAAFQAFLEEFSGSLSPKEKQYLDIGLRNVGRLNALIDDLLALTGVETGKLSIERISLPLAHLITETVESLQLIAAQKTVALKVELLEGLPPAYADPKRFGQILTNLLSNAIKFTPSNGLITVKAGLYNKDQNSIAVSVTDTGCGIKAEDLPRLFERLYQVSPKSSGQIGLGLGLYISKQLVNLHGGNIWATSQPGRGSTFVFTVPVFRREAARPRAPRPAQTGLEKNADT